MIDQNNDQQIAEASDDLRQAATEGRTATAQQEMDHAVAELQMHKAEWAKLDLGERIAILDQILLDLYATRKDWVTSSVQAKGTRGNDMAEAEEWMMLAYTLRLVRLYGNSLRDIQGHGRPQIPGGISILPNGQVAARVFPVDSYDRLIFAGMTADVWMQPGVTQEEMLARQARFYRREDVAGKVTLVLGAGNASHLLATDFMTKLFTEGSVVILKMNPVNDYLGPIYAQGFRALIERNFLRIVYGGADEGSYLCHHPGVDELHITGSHKTYEAILFGPGDEGARRKAQRRPLIKKRFTCELGNITPVIVVPGPWADEDVDLWGEKLASWLIVNAGFNCLSPRLIIQSANWEQRRRLNQAIAGSLAQVEPRLAYYPGAQQRHAAFLSAHPDCQNLGTAANDELPWTFIEDVDPHAREDICFREEPFCSLFAETALKAADVPSFVDRAVSFANEKLWGNLTATLIVHPESTKDTHVAEAVDRAVGDLRYGMVLINQYAGLGINGVTITWGAYPGNELYDIQSGNGVTFNTLMFDRPEKSVVTFPFSVWPDPLSLGSRTLLDLAKKLTDFQYRPSLGKLPGILWSALRS